MTTKYVSVPEHSTVYESLQAHDDFHRIWLPRILIRENNGYARHKVYEYLKAKYFWQKSRRCPAAVTHMEEQCAVIANHKKCEEMLRQRLCWYTFTRLLGLER